MSFTLAEPYRPRSFRFLEFLSLGGFRLKVYGITYAGEKPRPKLVGIAKELARGELKARPLLDKTYGVGFLGIHDGRGSSYVFLDRWANENELVHAALFSANDSVVLKPVTTADGAVCVWDIHLQNFEREAWLECVLKNPKGPDLDAYLARRLNGEA